MPTPAIPFSTLLTRLADPDPDIRYQTIRMIMHRQASRSKALNALLVLLKDPEERVCKAAIAALDTLGDPQAIPALGPLLSYPMAPVRLAALKAILSIDPNQAFPYLETALYDRSRFVADAAIKALASLGSPPAVVALTQALDDYRTKGCRYILNELLNLGGSVPFDVMMRALDEKSHWIRLEAVRALSKLHDNRSSRTWTTRMIWFVGKRYGHSKTWAIIALSCRLLMSYKVKMT